MQLRAAPTSADTDEVQLVVGPVDVEIARRWIDHTRTLVATVRDRRQDVSVGVDADLTYVVDSILESWESVAEGATTFYWRFPVRVDLLLDIVEQWLQLRELTDDQLRSLGVDPATSEMRPMTDAVIAAISVALEPLGDRTSDIRLRLRRYR